MRPARVLPPLALLFLSCAGPSLEEPTVVRILTWNIHHAEGNDDVVDVSRIATIIRRARPDVVALQEVDFKTRRSKGIDEPAEIARLLDFEYRFAEAIPFEGGSYGELILSRFPIAESRTIRLPASPTAESRVALKVRVEVDRSLHGLVIIGTHLDHQESDVERLAQVATLAEAAPARGGLPIVIAGDLNALPASPTLAHLTGSWTDASGGVPTWPSHHPTEKIDYVLIRNEDPWRIVESRAIDEDVASDHRPLLVVLEWPGEI